MDSYLLALIKHTIKENAYADLLLGLPPYKFDNYKGLSPYGYDLVSELEVLNIEIKGLDTEPLKFSLEKLSSAYEGVIPCLIFVLFIELKKMKKESNINFELGAIVANLKTTIDHNRSRFINDKSGVGKNYPDGLFGDVKRLCQNIFELSGLRIM